MTCMESDQKAKPLTLLLFISYTTRLTFKSYQYAGYMYLSHEPSSHESPVAQW